MLPCFENRKEKNYLILFVISALRYCVVVSDDPLEIVITINHMIAILALLGSKDDEGYEKAAM